MSSTRKIVIAKAALASMLLLAACKESAPPAKSDAKEEEENTNTQTNSSTYTPTETQTATDTSPCTASTSSSSDSDTSTDSGGSEGDDPFALTGKAKAKASAKRSFGLTSTVSYDSDIKSLLSANCTSCHRSGGDKPDLSSYSAAKSALSASISSVEADRMPKSSPLSSSDKQKLKDWQSAGAPESSSTSSSTDTDTDTDSSSRSTDCGSGSSTDDEVGDGYYDLVNPPELQECKDKGKVFDRKAGECHKAKVAEFSCDKAGILAAFKKVGVNADSKLSDITGDGYQIDQCGMYENEPIVYFTKQGESTGDSVSLKIKKLCKPTAEVCK